MTSATFETVLLDSIIIDRPNRQRRELVQLEELAASIATAGLINPPVITREGVIVAGERRLEACRLLGWTMIPVQYADTLDPMLLHLIELEENIKRVDLTWQDRNEAIANYHRLREKMDPAWSVEKSAAQLGMNEKAVKQNLFVREAIEQKLPNVGEADTYSAARSIVQRANERKQQSILSSLPVKKLNLEEKPVEEVERRAFLFNTSFLTWTPTATFNFLHCDFPYGVNAGNHVGRTAARRFSKYEDTADIYFELLDRLGKMTEIAEHAHMMFWFSMNFFKETTQILTAQGWDINPFPLIWHKTNAKMPVDINRQPLRAYETALFCTRGDRKIVDTKLNIFAAPVQNEHHSTEKNPEMLRHFLRMFVDEHTVMLDPTAGSANAVKVSEELGAAYSVGLEINLDFFDGARHNLKL